MQKSKHDVWVGLFVLLGAGAILFLALQAGNLLTLNFEQGYTVNARFDNIGGLKPQAAVRSAGVVVGRVESIGWILPIDDHSFRIFVVGRVREEGELSRMRTRMNGKLWEEMTEEEHRDHPKLELTSPRDGSRWGRGRRQDAWPRRHCR